MPISVSVLYLFCLLRGSAERGPLMHGTLMNGMVESKYWFIYSLFRGEKS